LSDSLASFVRLGCRLAKVPSAFSPFAKTSAQNFTLIGFML
jgi:hypothetical protein